MYMYFDKQHVINMLEFKRLQQNLLHAFQREQGLSVINGPASFTPVHSFTEHEQVVVIFLLRGGLY